MLEVSILEISRSEGELPYKETKKNFISKAKLEWVDNFQAFLEKKENDKNTHRRASYEALQEKLIKLKDYLRRNSYKDIDPIKYLWYLYYDEQLSLKDISTRLIHEWIYFSPSGLKRNLHDVFGWNLRDNYDAENQITKKKHRAKFEQEKVIAWKREKRIGELEELRKKALSLLDETLEQDIYEFNLQEYNRFKKGFDKIIYVFNTYYKRNIYEVIQSLRDEWLSFNSIVIIINNLCRELLIINQPTIREYPKTNKTTISNIIQ